MEVIKEKMHHIAELYDFALANADDRVKDWPLMQTPWPTLSLGAMYLTMVHFGPKIMANREPFQLRIPLIIYNLGAMLLNLYIGVEIAIVSVRLRYSWFCQPVSYSTDEGEVRIAAALWWYYISKCIEFADTLFFILRKKNNQLTFLHIYHHSTMFCLWWIGVKYVAGGSSNMSIITNYNIQILNLNFLSLNLLSYATLKYL
ncbi:unnamed protein product, partial [Meganyctiphanes norvegica]